MTESIAERAQSSTTSETIRTGSGMDLTVEKQVNPSGINLSMRVPTGKQCVLHWGLRGGDERAWRSLPQALWPADTTAAGPSAMQTAFKPQNGENRITISLQPETTPEFLEFALFFPEEGRWDNNGHRNYRIALPSATGQSPADFLNCNSGPGEQLFERSFEIQGSRQIAVVVAKSDGAYRVRLATNLTGQVSLHWGVARRLPHEWLLPPDQWRPAGTVLCGEQTAQSPFQQRDGMNSLDLLIPEADAPSGIQFVLKRGPDGPWVKNKNANFFIPISAQQQQGSQGSAAGVDQLGQRIVDAEMSSGSWTLMHRFNLCFDLLGEAQGNADGLALLFVWLRYSAVRQLTWQRNYNTKPRELAHAQDRLGARLAELYRNDAPGRPYYRLMLATIGHGGDGQRIRDEILQIMHRHHLKEVTGHFLEEWHQKLHNNTTPDDIVICEAYLEFLRSNGNLDRFNEVLQKGGVTRERLASFERPIRTNPDFVGHLKDALIHDFENFLKILNAVHSSTDLETAINTSRDRLDSGLQGLLWDVWNHRNDSSDGLVPLVDRITEARRRVSQLLNQQDQLRPLLYLDLALEQLVRVVVERNLHQHLSSEQLADLTGRVLENVTLSQQQPELAACLRHWDRLCKDPPEPRLSPGWSLHAKSVVDRISRALGDWTDRLYQTLQPKAESLGRSFQAETWTINLFSEEVVRGSSLGFALSMLLHQIDRALRQAASLSNWQIVSRGSGTGKVEVVPALRSVQGKAFEFPVVVIADKVSGDEELPDKVVAVLAPDVTDLVSHVAVRARNARVLFASCADPNLLQRMKALAGRFLHVEVTAAGDVRYHEADNVNKDVTSGSVAKPALTARPRFTKYAVTLDEFNEHIVGAKSCSQSRLRGKLPNWIKQPASLALPFGCYEQVLSAPENTEAAKRCSDLAAQAKADPVPEKLAALRRAIEELPAPEQLKQRLREGFSKTDLNWPDQWDQAWRCIKQVWASKWNERAVLSRKRIGLKDEDLFMAVLIQSVVPADYAFVIHTANPSTGNRDELYAEVVLGLGETLVGNFPGRALSFAWDKRNQKPRLISFPGKSVGLYGGGLIFRSDSNGEDLAGYAGAGLYDSVLMTPPRQAELDYSNEPLVWDEEFRRGLMTAIAKLGTAIEKSLGSPQDIEGAVAKSEYFVVQSRPQVGLDGGGMSPAQSR